MNSIFPSALNPGDVVSLMTPGFQVDRYKIELAQRRLEALGLQVILPRTLSSEEGYFAGTIEEKINEIHEAFANPEVKALIAVRGGFGSARLLPYLDYELIRKNPKIVLGHSDITALLLAISIKTGLITFHGPNAGSELPKFAQQFYQELLFKNKLLTFQAEESKKDDVISTDLQPYTLTSGISQGHLFGGNLTVLTSLIGTPYLPTDWSNIILFLEDIHEDPYRIERMLLQLKLAGVLDQLRGVVLGTFTHCEPKIHRSYSLGKILENMFKPLHIPCFSDAMIGHQPQQFTLPIGARIEMDANQGEIRMLELALS